MASGGNDLFDSLTLIVQSISEKMQAKQRLQENIDNLDAEIEALKKDLARKAQTYSAATLESRRKRGAEAESSVRVAESGAKYRTSAKRRGEGVAQTTGTARESLAQAVRAILCEHGRDMHIDEIFEHLRKRGHEITNRRDAVRALSKRIYSLPGITSVGEKRDARFRLVPEYKGAD